MAKILGINIDNYTSEEVMAQIAQYLKSQKCHQIVTVNPEFIVESQKNPEFRETLNHADMKLADGIGLKFAARFLKQRLRERITGVDLTWKIIKLASANHLRVFLLGGGQNVAKKTANELTKHYKNLIIVGTYSGTPEEEGLISKINRTKPDILLVAFGAPKQDLFISRNKNALQSKVAIGVGGTFDYISHKVSRAPRWMRQLGFEWLYRLILQPTRFKRIYNAVIVFPYLVMMQNKYLFVLVNIFGMTVVGYIFLNSALVFYTLNAWLITIIFDALKIALPQASYPWLFFALPTIIIYLVSYLISKSKMSLLFKAIFLTVPLGIIFAFIGTFFVNNIQISYSIEGAIALGILFYLYARRKSWQYFYSVIFTILVIVIYTYLGSRF